MEDGPHHSKDRKKTMRIAIKVLQDAIDTKTNVLQKWKKAKLADNDVDITSVKAEVEELNKAVLFLSQRKGDPLVRIWAAKAAVLYEKGRQEGTYSKRERDAWKLKAMTLEECVGDLINHLNK